MHRYSTSSASLSPTDRAWPGNVEKDAGEERLDDRSLEPYPPRLVVMFILFSCTTLWAGIAKLVSALI